MLWGSAFVNGALPLLMHVEDAIAPDRLYQYEHSVAHTCDLSRIGSVPHDFSHNPMQASKLRTCCNDMRGSVSLVYEVEIDTLVMRLARAKLR